MLTRGAGKVYCTRPSSNIGDCDIPAGNDESFCARSLSVEELSSRKESTYRTHGPLLKWVGLKPFVLDVGEPIVRLRAIWRG